MSTDVFLHCPPTNQSIESRTLQSVFPPSGVKIGPIFLTESWLQERLGAFFINEWISMRNWWGGRHGWASWRGYESHKSTQNENCIGKTILQLSTTFGAVWSSS